MRPSLSDLADLYIQVTDTLSESELTPEIMEARQDAFDILIQAGSKHETDI